MSYLVITKVAKETMPNDMEFQIAKFKNTLLEYYKDKYITYIVISYL